MDGLIDCSFRAKHIFCNLSTRELNLSRRIRRMPNFCHIVILKFKKEIGVDQIQGVYSSLQSLLDDKKIAGLLSFSGGPYSSPEGLNKDFTHAFSMVFEDEQSRNDYFPHPEHVAIKDSIIPMVDDVVAFDYAI